MSDRRRPPFARKRFGQHFLERAWIDKVIRAIDPRPDQRFIEIGPGRGALTRPLAAQASQVIAYEIDRDLAARLRAEALPNVTVVEGDFLDADVWSHVMRAEVRDSGGRDRAGDANGGSPLRPALRVAGNLPYNVASPILFRLTELYAAGLAIVDATVMLQREVAERVVAEPGSRDYGVLTVLTQHQADAEIVLKLPPGAFRPAPKVHSAVVRLRFHPPDPPVADPAHFAELVQTVFMHRRKTLENALRAYMRGRRSALGGRGRAGSEVGRGEGAVERGRRSIDADTVDSGSEVGVPEIAPGWGRRSTWAERADLGSEVGVREPRLGQGRRSTRVENADLGSEVQVPSPNQPPIDTRRRPETLSVREFAQLADWIKSRS